MIDEENAENKDHQEEKMQEEGDGHQGDKK